MRNGNFEAWCLFQYAFFQYSVAIVFIIPYVLDNYYYLSFTEWRF